MKLDLKHVNTELERLGKKAQLAKGSGYFYFREGEAADWIDTVVKVRKLNDLTLKQWMAEFQRLQELNHQMMRRAKPGD
jgi:hypothetical protein